MNYTIRPYHVSDFPAIYRICVSTADSGNDVSSLLTDPDLHPHYYAGPYVVLEPELCFIITADGAPVGYILGTCDSRIFRNKCEKEWFPLLRSRYALPKKENQSLEANLIRLIHKGKEYSEKLASYPAHLHIDLMPQARGKGFGKELMVHFCNKLKELKVTGLHLGVSKDNPGAVHFYEKVGFTRLDENDGSITFGVLFND